MKDSLRRMPAVLGAAVTALAVTAALSGAAVARSHPAASHPSVSAAAGNRMASFRSAARDFGVPASLLLAVGYNESAGNRTEPCRAQTVVNSSMPDDHTVIRGKTRYYQIVYNHRLFYLKAADVVVKYLH